MNKKEARRLLSGELSTFRQKKYEDLVTLMGSPIVFERESSQGVRYQIEVEVFWDHPRQPNANLRVLGSIDDGGFLTSFKPLAIDFLMSPTGEFLDE